MKRLFVATRSDSSIYQRGEKYFYIAALPIPCYCDSYVGWREFFFGNKSKNRKEHLMMKIARGLSTEDSHKATKMLNSTYMYESVEAVPSRKQMQFSFKTFVISRIGFILLEFFSLKTYCLRSSNSFLVFA